MDIQHLTPLTIAQRQTLVAQLCRRGFDSPGAIYDQLRMNGYINPVSKQPWSLGTLRNDVKEALSHPVQEIVGRTVSVSPAWPTTITKNVDATKANYQFWDNLRHGKAEGFMIGNLFCKPLVEKLASYVWGEGIEVRLVEDETIGKRKRDYTNDQLHRLTRQYRQRLWEMTRDLYALGDHYLMVDNQGSIIPLSPELVTKEWNPRNYRDITGIKVETKLDEWVITDYFTTEQRILTEKPYRGSPQVTTYRNLTGRLPIIPFACGQATNEIYGRPIYEALYRVFSRYDDLAEKLFGGTELMGNPTPVFEGMDNIDDTIDANKTIDDEEYTDIDGNEEERVLLNWDSNKVVFVSKGGSFKYAAPPVGFTADILNSLALLFWLILEHLNVPEALMGPAIQGSRASAESQMPPFLIYIESLRASLEGSGGEFAPLSGLHALFDVWLRTRALHDPKIAVAPVVIQWPALDRTILEDLLHWVQFLHSNGLIPSVEAIRLSGLINDPEATYANAQEEMKTRIGPLQLPSNDNQANLEKKRQAGKAINQGGGSQYQQLPLPDETLDTDEAE